MNLEREDLKIERKRGGTKGSSGGGDPASFGR